MARQKKGDIETNYEVRSFDAGMPLEEYRKLPKTPLYVVLDNLRSAFNVGSIFRLCDALRVRELILCGYTAHPPHVKLEKTSLGTTGYVPWRHVDSTADAVSGLRERGIPVWAAETTSRSLTYDTVVYPLPVALVFGNEITGVGREILDVCDELVEIPMQGFKNSINVAAAAAVMGYRVLSQIQKEPPDKAAAPGESSSGTK
ncbi:MAG: TrmH family RNA methyltransferase [Chitinivibrionales bacterium]|nr:TrmH family RNA methyltransferase [Chitinivibrionales bacterium]MBD3395266.1 TrmH family RNA methyltransferase [Chitinivibrionales bacterium]